MDSLVFKYLFISLSDANDAPYIKHISQIWVIQIWLGSGRDAPWA